MPLLNASALMESVATFIVTNFDHYNSGSALYLP